MVGWGGILQILGFQANKRYSFETATKKTFREQTDVYKIHGFLFNPKRVVLY